jgi:hypothetical protein
MISSGTCYFVPKLPSLCCSLYLLPSRQLMGIPTSLFTVPQYKPSIIGQKKGLFCSERAITFHGKITASNLLEHAGPLFNPLHRQQKKTTA